MAIEWKDNEAMIIFNREFYDMYPITEVCEKFQHLSKFLVCFKRDENIIEVIVRPKVEIDLEKLVYEFCNNCLHEQIKLSK